MKLKPYLQLTRAHTVPLEAGPALVGAIIGSGVVFSSEVLAWFIFGILYHLSGYGMNSYLDWKLGYDKNDPHKQHHPLNTGSLSIKEAKYSITILFIVTFLTALTLSILSTEPILSLIVLSIMILGGVAYNTIGKKTEFKFLFISLAHTMVFLLPYVATGGCFNCTEVLLAIPYMFLWIVFQISVSGEIKDVEVDEENLLKSLGTSYHNEYIIFSSFARNYAYALRILISSIAIIVAVQAESTLSFIMIFILSTLIFSSMGILIGDGKLERMRRIKHMSAIEAYTAVMFIIMYQHILGIYVALSIILGSILWVVLGNKYLWGTILAPDV